MSGAAWWGGGEKWARREGEKGEILQQDTNKGVQTGGINNLETL